MANAIYQYDIIELIPNCHTTDYVLTDVTVDFDPSKKMSHEDGKLLSDLFLLDDVQFSKSRSNFVLPPFLVELQLSKAGLDTFPPQIFSLVHLQRLDLSHNNLQSIPAEISQLTSLTFVNLCSNTLRDISPLSQVTSLQVILVNGNKLETLPVSYTSLKDLRRLCITHNKLVTFPLLPQVTTLVISQITSENAYILDTIAHMTQLLEISIFNSPIERIGITESFTNLIHVRKLIVSLEPVSEDFSEGLPLFLLFLPALQELEVARVWEDDEYCSTLFPQLEADFTS